MDARSMSTALFLFSLVLSSSWLSGACQHHLEKICESMIPNYNVSATPGLPPFNMSFSSHCYTPGNATTVTISGSVNVTGFVVEARKAANETHSYGVFATINNDTDIMAFSCFCGSQNAVGYYASNMTRQWTEKRFTWTPPAGLGGDIVFVTTIIQNRTIFWHRWENRLRPCNETAVDTAVVQPCPTTSNNTSSAPDTDHANHHQHPDGSAAAATTHRSSATTSGVQTRWTVVITILLIGLSLFIYFI